MKSFLLPVAVAALLLSGCSDDRPKDILSEDKMLDVMTDLQIAEAYDRSGSVPLDLQGSNKGNLGLAVLRQHGVTEEEMDSTLAWYGRNMDEYAKLYKKIDERLAKRQRKYAKAAGESDKELMSADLWPYGRHLVISDLAFADDIVMSIPGDQVVPGEKLTWKMRVQGSTSRQMTLGVDYPDGTSVIVKNSNYSSDLWLETVLQTDTAQTPVRIFGTLKLRSNYPRAFVDSIQLTHQPVPAGEHDRLGLQRRIGAPRRKISLPSDSTANSSLMEDSIRFKPSVSTSKSLGVSTRR